MSTIQLIEYMNEKIAEKDVEINRLKVVLSAIEEIDVYGFAAELAREALVELNE